MLNPRIPAVRGGGPCTGRGRKTRAAPHRGAPPAACLARRNSAGRAVVHERQRQPALQQHAVQRTQQRVGRRRKRLALQVHEVGHDGLRAAHRNHLEARLQPALQRILVHQRGPRARMHQRAGVVGGGDLDVEARRRIAGREHLVDAHSQRRAVRIADEFVRQQLLRADLLVRGQGMAARADAQQPGSREGAGDEVRMIDREGGNAQVGPLLQDPLLQRIVVEAMEVHLQVRQRRPQLGDRQRHDHLPEARARQDAHQAPAPHRQLPRQAADALHAAIDLLDLQVQPPGLGRGMQPPLDALEQREAQPALGMRQQPADGGHGHMEQARRPADGPGHHHGPEGFDLSQIHGPILRRARTACPPRAAMLRNAVPAAGRQKGRRSGRELRYSAGRAGCTTPRPPPHRTAAARAAGWAGQA